MSPRSRLEIMKDILVEAAPRGEKNPEAIDGAYKFNLMGAACLSFSLLSRYLKDLMPEFLQREEDGKFKTIEKGLEFLETYHEIQECLKKD